jgi:hypothetical protein
MTEEIVSGQDPAVSAAGIRETDSEPGLRLPPGQMALLTALVSNPDVPLASKAAGVSRATAFRWMRQAAFREELTRQRDEVLGEALATVKTHASRAAATLVGLLSATDDRLRRQVCNDILDRAIKVRELEDLERRLVALEKAMENKQNRRPA